MFCVRKINKITVLGKKKYFLFIFLVAIDCFSKFVFVEPLKRKTTEAIIDGFTRIFKKTTRRPENLRTDKGGEYNSL